MEGMKNIDYIFVLILVLALGFALGGLAVVLALIA